MKMIVMMRTRGPVAALLATAALLVTGACGATSASEQTAGSADRLTVVTSFYPLAFVAERVAGEHADVTNLTAPGAEPHDLELTPKQVASLSSADLVLYEQTLQPAVDEAVAQSGAPEVLDISTVVALQPLAAPADGHGHDPEHEDEHEDETGLDPHVWLDPTNLATIAAEVARRLAASDAANAADYQANADRLRQDLDDLDAEFQGGLADCRRTTFITSHAAFGYLARRYELTQIGISGISPDAEPSPARIAAVQREAEEHDVTTIFYETLVSPAVAEAIAGDLGLRTDVLDPLEGITEDSRGQDYLAVMRANLAALQKAGGCA